MTRLIVVDATPYGPEPSGTRRRAVELMRRVPGLMPEDVFEMHWAADGGGPPKDLVADNLVHATVSVSHRGRARRWLARRRGLLRRHREAPFTHLLTDYGPVIRPARVHNIVTVHDLRFLHGYGGMLRRVYGRALYGRALRRAHRVICASASVAEEAAARYGLAGSRTPLVIPGAPGAAFVPAPVGAERSGAVLVARDEPRKARPAAIRAAAEAAVTLEIVDDGRSDAELAATYQSAAWLLAPSLEEGFHLPVVEALACGTPVIASDIGAHRDLVALGAQGLELVAPPVREGERWSWPEASARMGAASPPHVAAPAVSWDVAAGRLAEAICGGPRT